MSRDVLHGPLMVLAFLAIQGFPGCSAQNRSATRPQTGAERKAIVRFLEDTIRVKKEFARKLESSQSGAEAADAIIDYTNHIIGIIEKGRTLDAIFERFRKEKPIIARKYLLRIQAADRNIRTASRMIEERYSRDIRVRRAIRIMQIKIGNTRK